MRHESITEVVGPDGKRTPVADTPGARGAGRGGRNAVASASERRPGRGVRGEGSRVERVVDLLGGRALIERPFETPLDTHRIIADGLPRRSVTHLVGALVVAHEPSALASALGMSVRTRQRLAAAPEDALSVEISGRAWQFAEVLAHATELFGSQEAAERWLETPATALEGEKPIDLLSTPPGSEMVRTLLTRIEFGVYA